MKVIKVLQNKQNGVLLFDSVIGKNVSFERIVDDDIICSLDGREFSYRSNGKVYDNKDAIVVLTPSRNMRDWSKFAWKKGDVLVSGESTVVFNKWANDSYTRFIGAYETVDNQQTLANEYETVLYDKANSEQINTYLHNIEYITGGKLNLSTLEIEKPEFKDGDIVFIKCYSNEYVFIFDSLKYGIYYSKASFNLRNNVLIDLRFSGLAYKEEELNTRPATDSEKQQLFDALAKEGKCWNSDTLQIEDLPKKCEFKALDYVLVKSKKDDYAIWNLYQFAYKGINMFCMVGNTAFIIADCEFLPYNDKTKHLLGTPDEWKGGEG